MSSHEITKLYFNKQNNEPNEFICRCGKRRKQDPKTRALSMSLVEQNASHQSLKFVKPTSNMIERYFQRGKIFSGSAQICDNTGTFRITTFSSGQSPILGH